MCGRGPATLWRHGGRRRPGAEASSDAWEPLALTPAVCCSLGAVLGLACTCRPGRPPGRPEREAAHCNGRRGAHARLARARGGPGPVPFFRPVVEAGTPGASRLPLSLPPLTFLFPEVAPGRLRGPPPLPGGGPWPPTAPPFPTQVLFFWTRAAARLLRGGLHTCIHTYIHTYIHTHILSFPG